MGAVLVLLTTTFQLLGVGFGLAWVRKSKPHLEQKLMPGRISALQLGHLSGVVDILIFKSFANVYS
jgi:hypothetical protein